MIVVQRASPHPPWLEHGYNISKECVKKRGKSQHERPEQGHAAAVSVTTHQYTVTAFRFTPIERDAAKAASEP
jgi:hypothetical protein